MKCQVIVNSPLKLSKPSTPYHCPLYNCHCQQKTTLLNLFVFCQTVLKIGLGKLGTHLQASGQWIFNGFLFIFWLILSGMCAKYHIKSNNPVSVQFILILCLNIWICNENRLCLQWSWKNTIFSHTLRWITITAHFPFVFTSRATVLCLCGESDSVHFPVDRRRKREENKKQASSGATACLLMVLSEKPLVWHNDRNLLRPALPSHTSSRRVHVPSLFINDWSVS